MVEQQTSGQEAAVEQLKKLRAWPWITFASGIIGSGVGVYMVTTPPSLKAAGIAAFMSLLMALHPQPQKSA